MTSEQQHCPVCGRKVLPMIRYPDYLCNSCANTAKSHSGRPLSFFNQGSWGGYGACYSDDKSPYESNLCYVGSLEVWADEARFGGIVLRPAVNGGRPADAYPKK